MAFNTARTVSRLDRRVKGDAVTSGFVGSTLTFTLPYDIATNGSEGTLVAARISTGLAVASTRPATNQIAVANVTNTPADYYIGVLYTFRYRLSTIYRRFTDGDERKADTRGRLILRYITAKLHDTTDMVVTVLLGGRTVRTYTRRNTATPDLPAEFRVPVQGKNTDATIEFVDTSPGICYVDSMDWEGTHAITTVRV